MEKINTRLKACWRCHRHVGEKNLYNVRGAMIYMACGEQEIKEYKALIEENIAAFSRHLCRKKAVGQ